MPGKKITAWQRRRLFAACDRSHRDLLPTEPDGAAAARRYIGAGTDDALCCHIPRGYARPTKKEPLTL